ncbi:hypothetical protein BU15DRAFT_59529 [Melanogaster broomeanus]|nr:hypothetical protein BU15DRAFT_59529 [Melanogaster broomeanus]
MEQVTWMNGEVEKAKASRQYAGIDDAVKVALHAQSNVFEEIPEFKVIPVDYLGQAVHVQPLPLLHHSRVFYGYDGHRAEIHEVMHYLLYLLAPKFASIWCRGSLLSSDGSMKTSHNLPDMQSSEFGSMLRNKAWTDHSPHRLLYPLLLGGKGNYLAGMTSKISDIRTLPGDQEKKTFSKQSTHRDESAVALKQCTKIPAVVTADGMPGLWENKCATNGPRIS